MQESPSQAIHCLFEMQARQYPQRKALIDEDKSFSYAELDTQANQLAHYLQSKGAKPGKLIGVCLERSHRAVMSIIAILKTGAAYIPLHYSHPSHFIAKITDDAKLDFFITDSAKVKTLSLPSFLMAIPLDTEYALICQEPTIPLENISFTDHHLAYIIYTSGTTGQPKGVMVSHQNLLATMESWRTVYRLDSEISSHLQMAGLGFDVFTGDWMRALCSGGRLVICPDHIKLDAPRLYQLMKQEKINCAEFVPANLRQLVDYLIAAKQRLDWMKLLVCGSDTWNIGEFKRVKSICSPATRVISSYGLTEASIDSTYFEPTSTELSNLADTALVPLGKPFPHVEVYLLGENLQPVTTHEAGMIYIGGKGVAMGYLRRDDLTQERFIQNPFSLYRGDKLYKTGDLGSRRLANDQIAFLGRADYQIKINGQRIELNAIESILRTHPEVYDCAVAVKAEANQFQRLQAFVVLRDKRSTHNSLYRYLQKHLPEYSIPHDFYQIDQCCLTTNGKIDRSAMSQLSAIRLLPEYVAPRNALEAALALVWQTTLQYQPIGVTNSFKELGGSSLQFAHALQVINEKFSVNLQLCHLGKDPTIESLAKQLQI